MSHLKKINVWHGVIILVVICIISMVFSKDEELLKKTSENLWDISAVLKSDLTAISDCRMGRVEIEFPDCLPPEDEIQSSIVLYYYSHLVGIRSGQCGQQKAKIIALEEREFLELKKLLSKQYSFFTRAYWDLKRLM